MVTPRVSVLLPVFNGERYLDEAVESILRQEGVSLELIIIDDASTDQTSARAQKWADADGRVTVLRQPRNAGASSALNEGLAIARGEFIARLDSDDVSLPGRLQAQVEFLDRTPEVVLVGTNMFYIDDRGNVIGVGNFVETSPVLAYLLNFSNALGFPSQGMFRAEVARAAGGFSSEFQLAQGYELWSRLARRGHVAVLDRIGIKYRVHDQQVSALFGVQQRAVATEVSRRQISSTLGRTLPVEDAEIVNALWRVRPTTGIAARGDGIIREVYATFASRNTDPQDRRRARELTALRFAASFASHVRSHQFADAIDCLRIAASWHPRGYPGIAMLAAKRILSWQHRSRLKRAGGQR